MRNRSNVSERLIPLLLIAVCGVFYLTVLPNSLSTGGTPISNSPTPPGVSSIGAGPASIGSREAGAAASFSSVPASRSLMLPMAGPTITATKDVDVHTHAHLGDTLTYTVVISNTGMADATGVNFLDTIDPNTTLVAGSLAISPIAVNDTYNTIGNVNISVPAGQGLIANDLNPGGMGTLTVTKVNATPSGNCSFSVTVTGVSAGVWSNWSIMAGSQSCLLQPDRHTAFNPSSDLSLFPPHPRKGQLTPIAFVRSSPLLRNAATNRRRKPQGGQRATRPLYHCADPRHVQPCITHNAATGNVKARTDVVPESRLNRRGWHTRRTQRLDRLV